MLSIVALHVLVLLLGQADLISSKSKKLAAADCILSFTNAPNNIPLLTNGNGIIYPKEGGSGDEIVITGGQCFTASCSPSTNLLETYSVRQIDVCCSSAGLTTSPAAKPTSFKELGCSKPIQESIRNTEVQCAPDAKIISIEFTNTNNQYSIITLCHDLVKMDTLWAHNTLHGHSISAAEISNARPGFKKAQFYPSVSPATAYTQSSQKSMVAKLVNSSSLADQYITTTGSLYLVRGHLAPDGDFIYVSEQNATYYFVNVVPQWQSINNGNWKALEVAARNVAGKCGTLEVYTGGYGVLQLNDVNNKPVDIYLATDPNSQKPVLTVPRLTWKMLHCPEKDSAVACLMVNNPHQLGVTSSDIICKDIKDQISWVTWDGFDTRKGYTYCCNVNEFSAAVPYAPKITATNLLN